jgi:hypothetical protein
MCQSPSNPQVAAATAAAQGVLTPQPCMPVTTTPWSPGNTTVRIKNLPVLMDNGSCNCTWAGKIQVQQAAQQQVVAQSGSSSNSATTLAAVPLPASVERPNAHHVAHAFVCAVTGKPVAKVAWQLRSATGELVASGTTGETGSVVAPVPQPGQHSLEFDPGGDDAAPPSSDPDPDCASEAVDLLDGDDDSSPPSSDAAPASSPSPASTPPPSS